MIAPAVLLALRKNKTLRYGVPMLDSIVASLTDISLAKEKIPWKVPDLLVVGGSFGLREFSQIRYDAVTIKEYTRTSVLQAWKQRSRKLYYPAFSHVGMPAQSIDPELEKKLKVNKITLESEYEKIKDSTFENWKNIRGPRPWEDPQLLQGRNPETLKPKTT
ncbi:Cytochrome c oxidase assembly protein COX16 homolog, mitochondrial [Apodemus speciosus]|uniref:Cytochrome c oxidase assembly protein COX16 homolog, mitochondrial n=1 Tax=Apodemus speciosus TaxID=105296 RepID=A0ABQ0FEB9_APOSI